MKRLTILTLAAMTMMAAMGETIQVKSPDGKLIVNVEADGGTANYSINYDGKQMMEPSALGFIANTGDFAKTLTFKGSKQETISDSYDLKIIKKGHVDYNANQLTCEFENGNNAKMNIVFRVSNNDVAFRYEVPKTGETGSIRIMSEATGFAFPSQTTTFLCPQSDPMIGWKRTKPSYEEEYKADAPMTDKSQFGKGYTFPCLFRVGNDGWVLVSETGVDSHYCASHLSDYQNDSYSLAFPMAEENNGNGTVEPAFALPGATPWRTITVGSSLKPIVETTAAWDNVKPLYTTENNYKYGRGTWSWILWQDESINYEDQVKYIDFASSMSYEYVLIDNWWDTNIGTERMEQLVKYAQSKNVDIFLWYSSSGYWNDIVQGPINRMDNSIIRKQQMRWIKNIGVKGIKVDFWGGDKQETMRLYEDVLSDSRLHLAFDFHRSMSDTLYYYSHFSLGVKGVKPLLYR